MQKLASFSFKRPKTVLTIAVLVVLGGFAVHYRLLVNANDRLEVERDAYAKAVETFEAREATWREDIRREREAAAVAAAERNEARRSLEALREGRADDPEALEWAAESLPVGEIERLCVTLPEMDGCQSTVPND